MWKRLIEKMKGKNRRKGYTLTEMMVVVGIIAIVCAIAIPSIITISRSLKFKQRNDYAKTIFMAAQANLSELRSDGSLALLQGLGHPAAGMSEFPAEDWADEYVYTTSRSVDEAVYAVVLPVNSVESALRDEQVIIEYNPYTGNVYSVFYSEESEDIVSLYTGTGLPRNNEAQRKKMMLGYYDGSGLPSTQLELEKTTAEVLYTNGEEGIVTVKIPMPSLYYSDISGFMEGLEVTLTLTGETSGGEVTILAKQAADVANCALDVDGKTVLVNYVLDSLVDSGSFANKVIREGVTATHLTQVKNEADFTILPGENVTIKAEVNFTDAAAAVDVETGILPGVNPFFDYMEISSEDGRYILAVSNGRNLQNLNAIAPSVAASVDTVVFTDDVYWNRTVAYYNEEYAGGGTYSNTDEAPARSLPYFVPINNQNLFGSAYFLDGTTPVIQDKHDATALSSTNIEPADHADIVGDSHRVVNLVIDATKYDAQTAFSGGEYYVSNAYTAADGTTVANYQQVDYYFAGLFAYANTNIDGLSVVNPIVKGYSYSSSAAITTATGAMLGASGYNTLVTNCGVYIDKNAEGYNSAAMTGPAAYSAGADQTWYGVSGQGSVGGLVGYAKSHRTASGDLTDDTSELAFSYCFAAVPVSGDMRGNTSRYYGYTNGVGGFIGTSVLTNFYGCYSSGDVLATGVYVQKASGTGTNSGFRPGHGGGNMESSGTKLTAILIYEGRTSMGAGGFVGTSHGTRYTNCFATGDVSGTTASSTYSRTAGVGGFVGIMCYDEGFNYIVTTGSRQATERIEQLTVFDSCYSAGQAKIANSIQENFSGANGRIYTYSGDFYSDYYKLYAPYYTQYKKAPSYPSTTDTDSNEKNDAYYIYKDSYYLSQEHTDNSINVNSNDCASVASYDLLTNLFGYHRNDTWLMDRVAAIGQYKRGNQTYANYYSSRGTWTNLSNGYMTQLREGFPLLNWESATAEKTHPYSMNAGAYPFSMLSGMDYYGDWPTRPLEGGIAYYEDYQSGSVTTRGIYFDRENTATILEANELGNYTLVSDGYAILTGNTSDSVVVTVEGSSTQYTLTGKSSGTFVPGAEYGSKSFAVFPLPKAVLDAAANSVAADNFYVKIQTTVTPRGSSSSETYTMYFNPNAAKSHMNPSSGTTAGDPGSAIPSQISIRTARQLAALSSADTSWTAKHNYVQELDIDCSTYTASSYAGLNSASSTQTDAQLILGTITDALPIGTSDAAFNGTYNGSNGVKEQVTVVRDDTYSGEPGLFGVIGETGAVKNLIIEAGTAGTTTSMGSTEYENTGIVASVINGTVDNVDLKLVGPVSLTAKTNAGLFAGSVGGTVSNSDVIADETVKVTATNVGGAVGAVTENGTVIRCNVELKKTYTTEGSNAGGFAGTTAGAANSLQVTLTGGMLATDTANQYAGGYAGSITGGSATSVQVNLAGTNGCVATESNPLEFMGGIAGSASNATLADVKANVSGNLAGDTAAGLLGTATAVKVQNSGAAIAGTVNGTTAAAGIAGATGSGSSFTGTSVSITNGTITSAGTAAGYAVNLAGTVSGGTVTLSGGTINGTNAAGFAGTVSGTVSTNSAVVGTGNIDGTNAAGFAILADSTGHIAGARVAPATSQTAAAYLGNSNDKLKVNGTTAAGFVLTVNSGARVINCDALCKLTGTTASGFTNSNAGTIDGSMANVTLTGGYAFVNENTGTVSYCYGWYGNDNDTDGTTVAAISGGKCYSSYFADLDITEEDGTQATSVQLYDSTGASKTMAPSGLSSALAALNGSGNKWYAGGKFDAYPYDEDLKDSGYLYPMHREHSGDWVVAPRYAYGVIYYEKYEDTTWAFEALDLSDGTKTVEGKKLFESKDNVEFGSAGTIVEAGYAVYCRAGENPFTEAIVGELITDTTLADAINAKSSKPENKRYSVYKLNADGAVTVEGVGGDSATVVTWYADTINQTGGAYQIRTSAQLANIGKMNASFLQTHNIALDSSFATVDTLSGSFDGNGYTVTAGAAPALITNVSGTVSNLAFTADSVSASLLGTVSGTVQNSTITVGEAPALITTVSGKVSNLTAKADKISTSALGTVNGTVEKSSVTVGTAAVNGGTFGVVASTVGKDGKITDTTVSGTVNVTGTDDAIVVIGGIAGANSGTVSGGSANVTINYTQASSDAAVIGGLVGQMDGGSITGTTASGAINLKKIETAEDGTTSLVAGSGSGRSYIIGGAIGKDGGAAYSDIASTVSVDTAWAGSAAQTGSEDPAGKGPVGMFVGYVSSGKFESCSNTAANSTYQFLGQIAVTSAALGDSGAADWFSHSSDSAAKTVTVSTADELDTVPSGNNFAALADDYTYRSYSATLSDCTFVNSGSSYYQKLNASEYFYLGEKATQTGGHQLTAAQMKETYAENSSVKYSNLYDDNNSVTKRETDYYYKKTDGSYVQVYVTVSKTGSGYSTKYTYSLVDNSGNALITLDQVQSNQRSNTIKSGNQTVVLYTKTESLVPGQYLITDSGSTYAFAYSGNTTASKVQITYDANGYVTNSDALTQWTVDSNGYWKHGNNYLYLRRQNSNNYFVSSNTQKITVAQTGSGFTIYGNSNNNGRYLTYSSNFQLSQSSGTLKIYTLTLAPDIYSYVFSNDDKLGNWSCTMEAVPEAAAEVNETTETTTPTDETVGGDTQETNS